MSIGPSPLPPAQPPDVEQESADLFDYRQVKNWVAFVLGGLLRHKLAAAAVFVGVAVLGTSAALLMPKTFHVETKILAQRNQVMASLGNPHRAVPYEADAPTRAAYETVLRRDNLVSLIKQTNLVDQWDASRTGVFRLKDAMFELLGRKVAEEDKLDAMVGLLEKELRVETDQATVTIGINWRDPQMAYQLVEAAQQNFLEARHVSEVSAIAEAISILEMHASSVRESIDQALDELQKVHSGKKKPGAATNPAPADGQAALRPAAGGPTPSPNPGPLGTRRDPANAQELSQLKFLIRAKRRAVADLEEMRQRRLTELQAQLAELKVSYSEQHPTLIDTQRRIDAMKMESPQILALKHDEAALVAEYTARGGKDPESLVEPGSAPRVPRTEGDVLPPSALGEDPSIEYARSQLRMAQAKYEDLTMRIDAARIELDTARAAFKYRYSVLSPAQAPKRPIKPNVPAMILGSIFIGLFLGLLAGAAIDLWRGKIVEKWQVEKVLKVPVLAEVNRS